MIIKKFKLFETKEDILNKILDKINKMGYENLSSTEKEFLEKYPDVDMGKKFDIDEYLKGDFKDEFSDERLSAIEDFLERKFKIMKTDSGKALVDQNNKMLTIDEIVKRVRWEFSIEDKDKLEKFINTWFKWNVEK